MNKKECLPECRTKFDMRRAKGSRHYVIHSPHCQAGCSEPLPNPIDEANAPKDHEHDGQGLMSDYHS